MSLRHLAVCLIWTVGLLAAPNSAIAGTPGGVSEQATAQPLAPVLSARDAGVRFGQAAGAAAVCENTHATAKAETLGAGYQGADQEAFKLQAETVLAAWKQTLTCEKTGDPNQCRLVHQLSCKEAYKEIGPDGSMLPGLVEYRRPN